MKWIEGMTMSLKQDALQIFNAAIERVNPQTMIEQRLQILDNKLLVKNDDETLEIDLSSYKKILVLGAGKASAKMALGLEAVLRQSNLEYRGLLSVKYGHTQKLENINLIEAGHPVPDDNSFLAGERIFDELEKADEQTMIISLISGGGSALLCKPFLNPDAKEHISAEDMQELTKLLLGAGTPIEDINCIRKHISGIKGGRFVQAAHPARIINIILSDVVGDPLDAIASGLGVADPTKFEQAVSSLKRYNIWDDCPLSIQEHLEMGLKDPGLETPKPGNTIFDRVSNVVLGNNAAGLIAASAEARSLGYSVQILSSRLIGEAREMAKLFAATCLDSRNYNWWGKERVCLIAGGETTVTLKGKGKGGRNQELALSYGIELVNGLGEEDILNLEQQIQEKRSDDLFPIFLSAASDGNDGPTDAAGGIIDVECLRQIHNNKTQITKDFDNNNAYEVLDKLNALVKTGPTNTNVCDYQILLLPRKKS
jgi:glycerate 2-kinase